MSTGLRHGLKSTGMDLLQIPTKSQGQSNLFNQTMGQAQSGIQNSVDQWNQLAGGGNEDMWSKLEAPAMRQFGALQGNLASRFSGGMGAGGSGMRKSSGFRNTMNEAGMDLAERLQGQRMGLQQGAQDRLMSLFQQIMGHNEFENVLAPKSIPFWKQLILSGMQGGSQAVGNLAGGAAMKGMGFI